MSDEQKQNQDIFSKETSPKRSVEELREDVLEWIEKEEKIPSKKKELPKTNKKNSALISEKIESQKSEPAQKEILSGLGGIIEQLKKSKRTRSFILGLVVSILVIIIIISTIVGFGLYKYQWNNKLINLVIKIIPYPVATVNGQWILYSNFREDIETLDIFYVKQKEVVENGLIPTPPRNELEKNILDRMIKDKLVQASAKKYNIKIKRKEIEDELANVISQAGGEAEVKKTLSELYNWSSWDFKKRVLAPYLLRQKLQKAIESDENLDEDFRNLDAYLEDQQKKAKITRFINIE